MATRIKIDAAALPAFKTGSDPRNDWLKWRKAFERFMVANGIEDDDEKYNLLLVLGGIELQTYYDKIEKLHVGVPTTEEGSDVIILKYESAALSLEKYFAPQLNKRFERHLFRALKQEVGESFEDFVFKLKEQANRCKFSDVDDMIVDQIIEGCNSLELRKKLLTEEKDFSEALMIGRTIENVQKQAKQYSNPLPSGLEGTSLVQRVADRQMPSTSTKPCSSNARKCYNCGRYGHIAKDIHKCAAKDAKCHNCGTKGHFKICCNKRKSTEPREYTNPKRKVHAVLDGKSEEVLEKGIFLVTSETKDDVSEILTFYVRGVSTNMVVDSGSPANIMQESTYKRLKKSGAQFLNERDATDFNPQFEAFASTEKICYCI
ncbi:uncharacterized protein LOC134206466 [Armigeres subalbatus]|uniref:uncharacterized protein LOC134206466 n=1 Tax=Armigeres subalbatus TaxID=124917 RepID=UPI002ED371F5